MTKLKIAHIRRQGQDIIILPLDTKFHNLSNSEQQDIIEEFQRCASSAGLAGTVVPAWLYNNKVYFIAPIPWQPFFKSLSWNAILANINKELTCG